MKEKNNILNFSSFKITGINQLYIEKIYQDFLSNSNSISNSWKNFFQENDFFKKKKNIKNYKKNIINFNHSNNIKIFKLINFFRTYGHKYANLDPINLNNKKNNLVSSLLLYGFNFFKNNNHNSLQDINNDLKKIYIKYKNIYCASIGIEYMHIDNIDEQQWIQDYIEKKIKIPLLNQKNQINILNKLIQSETLEKYLNTKFPGSKRFSLEGAEVLIPMLDNLIIYANNYLSSKILIGMAHRGRLNVLVNILGKKIGDLCHEFSNIYQSISGTGDAKYHAGMTSKINIKNKIIEIDLKPNPSHLEIINPVIMGSTRAVIENTEILDFKKVLPINIHGDSAIIGQGINQELLNMSQTNGYNVGGTIHIIINNQIGFTTSKKNDIRSSEYCTDIAKMIQAPILHVNADDPESVIYITKLASDFRYKFKKDIFIDLVCYRRNGHNEADDPSVTQPIMYQKIKNHPTICKIYSEYLENNNIINNKYTNDIKLYYRNKFEKNSKNFILYQNNNIVKKQIINKLNIKTNNLKDLAIQISYIPNNITLHDRVYKIYQERYKMAVGKIPFDWGAAENLAYANLLNQGISCRLSGEDISRGTFFHRHSIVHDQKNGIHYTPLNHLKNKKGKFYIWDSVLSEEAVLAFEYGYSIDSKNTLNIWEAQFGDFVNGAQIVIDQFITSGEQKWGINSNLVIFLPHGYEGQGPEHSSARLERFLQLCSQDNIKVCIPSKASQIYHILINQAFNNIKKPLIVISPKSLLRHPMSSSPFIEIEKGNFYPIIYEIDKIDQKNVNRIILCSGKIYYELLKKRRQKNQLNILLIRIEQLYPFPQKELYSFFNLYNQVKNIIWCQEEPKNQGAWYYIQENLKNIISVNARLTYIGRPDSAAPAVGSIFIHQIQQKKIVYDALNIN